MRALPPAAGVSERLQLLVDGGARCIDVRAKSTAAGTDTHKRPLSARNVLTGEGAVETHTASAHISAALSGGVDLSKISLRKLAIATGLVNKRKVLDTT